MNINRMQLFQIRQALGLTLNEMGALMEMSGVNVHHIEKGNRTLTKDAIDKLAREIGLDERKLAALIEAYEAEQDAAGHKERARHKLRRTSVQDT